MGASSRKTVSRDTKPSRSKKAHDKQADQATTPPSTAGDSDEDAPGELIEDYGIHPSIERPEALGHGSVTCNPTEAASLITAGEEAKSVFGQSLTIPDMHKPKADEPRARKLKLRKDPKILNMNRPCNIEATLNHIRGTRAVQMCKSCTRGHGPFTDCVFVEGSMMAACANCWFNACGTRCSFQETAPSFTGNPNVAATRSADTETREAPRGEGHRQPRANGQRLPEYGPRESSIVYASQPMAQYLLPGQPGTATSPMVPDSSIQDAAPGSVPYFEPGQRRRYPSPFGGAAGRSNQRRAYMNQTAGAAQPPRFAHAAEAQVLQLSQAMDQDQDQGSSAVQDDQSAQDGQLARPPGSTHFLQKTQAIPRVPYRGLARYLPLTQHGQPARTPESQYPPSTPHPGSLHWVAYPSVNPTQQYRPYVPPIQPHSGAYNEQANLSAQTNPMNMVPSAQRPLDKQAQIAPMHPGDEPPTVDVQDQAGPSTVALAAEACPALESSQTSHSPETSQTSQPLQPGQPSQPTQFIQPSTGHAMTPADDHERYSPQSVSPGTEYGGLPIGQPIAHGVPGGMLYPGGGHNMWPGNEWPDNGLSCLAHIDDTVDYLRRVDEGYRHKFRIAHAANEVVARILDLDNWQMNNEQAVSSNQDVNAPVHSGLSEALGARPAMANGQSGQAGTSQAGNGQPISADNGRVKVSASRAGSPVATGKE